MSAADETDGAGGAMPPATVRVWDMFVRIFHWSLAALFVAAYATGDEIEGVHVAAGYAIAALIAARVVWGFVGPRHARFASFLRSPRAVLAYLRDIVLLRAPRHIGHNPAGGAMIVALLSALAGAAATGYMMTTDAYWGSAWVEGVHKVLANLTLGLVVVHVLGVLAASFAHRENLVRAMVTGRKRVSDETRRCRPTPASGSSSSGAMAGAENLTPPPTPHRCAWPPAPRRRDRRWGAPC